MPDTKGAYVVFRGQRMTPAQRSQILREEWLAQAAKVPVEDAEVEQHIKNLKERGLTEK